MKHKKLMISILILLIAVCGLIFFMLTKPDENEKVRRVLVQFTRLADKPSTASAAELAVKLRTLQTVFCEQVMLDIRTPAISEIYTPRSLEPLLIRYRKHFSYTQSGMNDLEINISGNRADALFSLHLTGVTLKGYKVDEVRDINCVLVKSNDIWRIEKVTVTNILER